MPTYEYFCPSCKKKFDQFQSITEKPLASCPKCKKGKPERLISSGAGLIFKGSGFYITDYKNKPSTKSSKPGSGSSSKSE